RVAGVRRAGFVGCDLARERRVARHRRDGGDLRRRHLARVRRVAVLAIVAFLAVVAVVAVVVVAQRRAAVRLRPVARSAGPPGRTSVERPESLPWVLTRRATLGGGSSASAALTR